jgi:dTDP-4-dehydrorhamnose reductase
VYGASKLAGEHFVRGICPRHAIVRTCGLYGANAARGKGNFVETMLRLGRERPELKIVADQRCTPTSTADLARALAQLVETDATGTYHATNSGDCSWYQFALEIFRLANLPVRAIPITASEYAAKARRPDDSVLDSSRLASLLGTGLPPWQDALKRYLVAIASS